MNYLTEDLKIYYESALLEVIDSQCNVGQIDDGLKGYLISINRSKNIRTLFSKKGNHSI